MIKLKNIKNLATEKDLSDRLEQFSHAVITPIHTVVGAAELMRDSKLDEQQLALLSSIVAAAKSVLTAHNELFMGINSPREAVVEAPGSVDDDFSETAAELLNKTILVVDDNRVNLTLTKKMLERAGYTVRTAVDGREALDIYQTRPVSLILLDLEMPIMDGFEACSSIRKKERGQDIRIPIVALTATGTEGITEQTLTAGFDDCLCKPLSRKSLLEALKSFLC